LICGAANSRSCYVDELARRMYHDHWAKHPGCTTLLDMKIPLQEGAEKIGYAPSETQP
jgi:hypothetical protein